MKRLSLLATAFAFVAVIAFCGHVFAQQTSTGAFGSRTIGSAGGTTAPRGGSTSSRGNTTGVNFGQGTGASMMQQATGAVDTSARYIRNNRTAQDFVGADTGDTGRAVGVLQSGGNGRNGAAQQFASLLTGRNGNLLGQFTQGQFNQPNQRQRSSATPLRVPIRMGVDFKPAATAKFTGQFQKRLGKLPGLTTVGPIEVLLEGEVVVLRGAVASEGDRRLAEELAMLEPEVSQVKNELTVQAPAGSAGEALPAPTTATP